jgi:hypothetical protein
MHDIMPDTLPRPLPNNYGVAEAIGFTSIYSNSTNGGRTRVIKLNLRTRVAKEWRMGKAVDLHSNPKAVLGEAWYRDGIYDNAYYKL